MKSNKALLGKRSARILGSCDENARLTKGKDIINDKELAIISTGA